MKTFTYEHVGIFNRVSIENSWNEQRMLYLVKLMRINELKMDICSYVSQILDDDEERVYFIWHSAQINKKIAELCELGCSSDVDNFFEYGYWL